MLRRPRQLLHATQREDPHILEQVDLSNISICPRRHFQDSEFSSVRLSCQPLLKNLRFSNIAPLEEIFDRSCSLLALIRSSTTQWEGKMIFPENLNHLQLPLNLSSFRRTSPEECGIPAGMESLPHAFGRYPEPPYSIHGGSPKSKRCTLKAEVVALLLGFIADVTSDDPVWRACALSWIATRLDDLEYMVEMDRSSLDEAFKKVSGRLQKDPPRTLTEDEVNDEKIVAFIAKYESGGETSSWGDKTLEWLNAIAQWDDMCLWNEFKANEEAWRQEHIAFWGYDR